MSRAPVCVLLFLLWSLGGASSAKGTGGLCRVWRPETRLSFAVFSCPEKRDPSDAVFCCGTCSMPRCCSSERDRLNQRRCHRQLLPPTPPPPPAALPADWYYMWFFLGVVMVAFSYTCVNLFSTQIWNCLMAACCPLRRPWCCSEPRQEVQAVAVNSLPTLSVIDTPPSSTCASMRTVSTLTEDQGGTMVLPRAWDDVPVRGHLASNIPENDAIVLLPAALLNTSASCPILEVAMETEDLLASGQ